MIFILVLFYHLRPLGKRIRWVPQAFHLLGLFYDSIHHCFGPCLVYDIVADRTRWDDNSRRGSAVTRRPYIVWLQNNASLIHHANCWCWIKTRHGYNFIQFSSVNVGLIVVTSKNCIRCFICVEYNRNWFYKTIIDRLFKIICLFR